MKARIKLHQGPDDNISNNDRADWAEHACLSFAQHTGQRYCDEPEDCIKDLITDLLHLAMSHGLDTKTLIGEAFHSFGQGRSNTETSVQEILGDDGRGIPRWT